MINVGLFSSSAHGLRVEWHTVEPSLAKIPLTLDRLALLSLCLLFVQRCKQAREGLKRVSE